MTTVFEIQLNGARYPIACNEGETARIQELAQQLHARLEALHKDLGHAPVSDAHLLALLGLILMDEVSEKKSATTPPATAKTTDTGETELFINAVSHLTERVNLIARRLEAA